MSKGGCALVAITGPVVGTAPHIPGRSLDHIKIHLKPPSILAYRGVLQTPTTSAGTPLGPLRPVLPAAGPRPERPDNSASHDPGSLASLDSQESCFLPLCPSLLSRAGGINKLNHKLCLFTWQKQLLPPQNLWALNLSAWVSVPHKCAAVTPAFTPSCPMVPDQRLTVAPHCVSAL